VADEPNRAGVVHNHPVSLRAHLLELILHTQPYACQVGADDSAPVFLGAFSRRGERAQNASVVKGTMQRAKDLYSLRDQGFDLGRNERIGLDKPGIAAPALDHPRGVLST